MFRRISRWAFRLQRSQSWSWCHSLSRNASRRCWSEPALYGLQPIFWGTWAALKSPLAGTLGFIACLALTAPKKPALSGLLLASYLAVAFRAGWLAPDERVRSAAAEARHGMIRNFPLREIPATCPATTTEGHSVLLVFPNGDNCPPPGSHLEWMGKPAAIPPGTNPGGFDARQWYRSLGLVQAIEVQSWRPTRGPGFLWRQSLIFRQELKALYQKYIPTASQALVLSTVLGDMRGLSRATKRDFQNTGMLHILAISGQHIALMAAIGIQAFRLARLPKRLACLAIALGLCLYGPATGWSSSVVRSIWMFWLLIPAIVSKRPFSPWTTLSLAASLSLVLEPETLHQIGWQLSYLATLTLLLYAKPCEAWSESLLCKERYPSRLAGCARSCLAAMALSSAVTLGTLPVIAASSHVIMPVSPLANLVTVPLGSGLLTSAFLTAAFFPLPWLAQCMGSATGFFAWALEKSVHVLAQWQSGLVALSGWPSALAFAWLLLMALWPFLWMRYRRKIALAVIAAASLYWAGSQAYAYHRRPILATLLDVGQGQALLLEMAGKTILIDAGPDRPNAGYRAILPALRAKGWNRIDLILLSHGDADHIGGLKGLIEEIPIGRVALGGPWPDRGSWPGLSEQLTRLGIPFGTVIPGTTVLSHGCWRLSVLDLHLPGNLSRNDGSAIVILNGPPGTLIIPGDIERGPEKILADSVRQWRKENPDLPLWLVIPHHGSDRTNDTESLLAMKPDLALISAGQGNRFGHPGPGVMRALRSGNIPVLSTLNHGAIQLQADKYQARWSWFLSDLPVIPGEPQPKPLAGM